MPNATTPVLTIALLLMAMLTSVVLGWALCHRLAARRASHRRIHGARVRAGLVPRDIPTLPGAFAESDPGDTVASDQELRAAAESAVVDEKPVVRLKYVDRHGQRVRCTMHVDKLDLRRMTLEGRCGAPDDLRSIPIAQITGSRMAATGHRFDMAIWLDAVRSARRRRGLPL